MLRGEGGGDSQFSHLTARAEKAIDAYRSTEAVLRVAGSWACRAALVRNLAAALLAHGAARLAVAAVAAFAAVLRAAADSAIGT